LGSRRRSHQLLKIFVCVGFEVVVANSAIEVKPKTLDAREVGVFPFPGLEVTGFASSPRSNPCLNFSARPLQPLARSRKLGL
jgi:hypothetical protein